MTLWYGYVAAFGPFPDKAVSYLLPYVQSLADEQEMRRVVAMKRAEDGQMTLGHVADAMRLTDEDSSGQL